MVKNIAIVSLSSGTIGEAFAAHEVEIGIRRLKEYGLNVIMKMCIRDSPSIGEP